MKTYITKGLYMSDAESLKHDTRCHAAWEKKRIEGWEYPEDIIPNEDRDMTLEERIHAFKMAKEVKDTVARRAMERDFGELIEKVRLK